jgi:hypothetical protein
LRAGGVVTLGQFASRWRRASSVALLERRRGPGFVIDGLALDLVLVVLVLRLLAGPPVTAALLAVGGLLLLLGGASILTLCGGLLAPKELACVLGGLEHMGGWNAQYFYDAAHLIEFGVTWEDGQAEEKLGADAPQAPHVDSGSVRKPEEHLGRTVEARLDVRVDRVMLETGRTEVDEFYLRMLRSGAQQHVLGFKVAMDDEGLPETLHCPEQLFREDANQCRRDSAELILLQYVVQIHAQKLEGDAKVLPVDEEVEHPNDAILVVSVEHLVQHLQDSHLDESLVEVRWLVFDDFQRHRLGAVGGLALENLPKRAMTEALHDLVGVPVWVPDLVGHAADVVMLGIIIARVVDSLRQLGQHPPRGEVGYISELLGALGVGIAEVLGHGLEEVGVPPTALLAAAAAGP